VGRVIIHWNMGCPLTKIPRIIGGLIGGLLSCISAAAQTTPCPTVSDGSRILPVTITGAPIPTYYGSFDLNTSYLFISYQNGTAEMLTGIPQGLIVGHYTVPWAAIYRYPSALMQERSICPLLSATNTPLLAQ
jgi:hypothetical protein